MSDYIVRAISKDGMINITAIDSRQTAERARVIHSCQPVATAALGRALSAASMLGNMLKVDGGSVTLQIKGGGPLGTILCVADEYGNIRGYVQNPHVALMEKYAGKLDVGAAVGIRGSLTVIKDLGLKEPYIGSVELVSGEIAEDLTAYFSISEQIPSACALGVLVDVDRTVKASGGYIIQLMPNATDEIVEKIESAVAAAQPVTTMLSSGMRAEDMIRSVLSDFDIEVLETCPVEYKCYCSKERVSRALISLGREELASLIDEQENATVECQFCDTKYVFTTDEIESLINSL